MRRRGVKTGCMCALGVFILILYGLFVSKTDIGVPCFFNTITGLQCPGCGVTHMCIALMQGDIRSAWQSNAMLCILSPVLLFIIADYFLRYIRIGRWQILKWQSITLYGMIGLLLLFFVYRNIVQFT